jgi:hypothetical protein
MVTTELAMVDLLEFKMSPPFPNWFKPDDLNLDFAGWIFFKRTRLKLASSSLF